MDGAHRAVGQTLKPIGSAQHFAVTLRFARSLSGFRLLSFWSRSRWGSRFCWKRPQQPNGRVFALANTVVAVYTDHAPKAEAVDSKACELRFIGSFPDTQPEH